MREKIISFILLLGITLCSLQAQEETQADSVPANTMQTTSISMGWVDEAVTIGYVTAPSVISLMFVSALVNDWNAGIAGIPASAMILLAPPLIYAGGRSVDLSKDFMHPRAKLAWTLYAISIIPTSLTLYGFTTDLGATLPLIITSGILGTASIIAMTSYAFSRAESAREINKNNPTSFSLGISPLAGGAMATLVLRF